MLVEEQKMEGKKETEAQSGAGFGGSTTMESETGLKSTYYVPTYKSSLEISLPL